MSGVITLTGLNQPHFVPVPYVVVLLCVQ